MEESNKVPRPSLPANYVTLLDLRERWMQQQKQNKKRDEDDGDKELHRNFEVKDDPAAKGDEEGVEQQHQPPEKSLLRSNRNPKSSNRKISSSSRSVQVNQPNPPTALSLNKPKPPAPPVQTRQPKPPLVVQIVEAKALPVIRVSQSKKKPPPLESPKVESFEVESCGEIPSSGKVEEKKKKKKPRRKKKRDDEKKDDVQLQPEIGVKENPEQGIEVGRGNNDVDYNVRAEIEGKLAGLSLSSGTGESSGGKSMAVRNRRRFRKEKKGSYGRFEGSVMLKERSKRESGLVWVKKGEAS